MRQLRQLDDGWVLLLGDDARSWLGTDLVQVPATVPGCVHTDLMAAGLLADSATGIDGPIGNRIGATDWTYRLDLDEPPPAPDEQLDLVCEGLDTLATICWNGDLVGMAANPHRRHRFGLAGVVTSGTDRLEIRFAAPPSAGRSPQADPDDGPGRHPHRGTAARRMACDAGADRGRRAATAGIWRPIRLERWDRSRIAAVRPSASVAYGSPVPGEVGRLSVVVELDHAPGAVAHPAGDLELDLIVRTSEGSTAARLTRPVEGERPGGPPGTVTLEVEVPTVERWWPIGVGAQPCYTIDCALFEDDRLLDLVTTRVGFRSVAVEPLPDAHDSGVGYGLVINGERIWIRGFNWVPDDCFPSTVTPERARNRIDEAANANANLLRIRGGGTYGDDAFYRHCDDIGVLLWQDVAFAADAATDLRDEILAEVADNIDRLMSHPSLMVWHADDVCSDRRADQGPDGEPAAGRRARSGLRSRLREVVTRLDPGRPYLDAGPTTAGPALHPRDPGDGPVDVGDPWNGPGDHHHATEARFVAEIGRRAPATHSTLLRAAGPGRSLTEALSLIGSGPADAGPSDDLADLVDLDDWLYLTQLDQARAVEVGVGRLRSLHRRCSGVIWWQLNDCRPAISWSVLDADGRRKPSWYAARRAMADRSVVLRPHPDGVEVVVVNDSWITWTPALSVTGIGEGISAPVTGLVGPLKVGAGTTASLVVAEPAGPGTPPERCLVVATAVGGRAAGGPGALRAVLAGPGAPCPEPELTTSVEPVRGGVAVTVAATTVIRDLCLFVDRVDPDAVVDDMVVTLLPGEKRTFEVVTATDVSVWVDALERPGPVVLRSLGDRPRQVG